MNDSTAWQTRKQQLSTLIRSLKDQPIEQGDPRYYAFHQAPGEPRGRDPIRELRSAIEMMNAEGTCQLFSGFHGSGKSTELRRLKSELEQLGITVLFIQGASYINLSQPVEPGDLLLSVSTAVAEAVIERTRNSPARESVSKKLALFFRDSPVEIRDVELNVGIAKVKAQLSRDPNFKVRVQEKLRNRLMEWVRQCDEFMQGASEILGAIPGGPRPVMIIDDLEKVRGSPSNADQVQRSIEEIFSQYAWVVRFRGWHTIWTVPPYLQLLNPGIPAEFDGCTVLPMVRLWRNDAQRTPDPDGLAAVLSCLRRRGDIDSLVRSPDLVEKVILASSGHLRDLVSLVRELVIEANIDDRLPEPLDEKTVQRVVDDYIQGYHQAIYDQDLPWLRRVAEGHSLSVPDGSMVQRAAKLMDIHMVMTCGKGRQWFDVHAAVRERLQQG